MNRPDDALKDLADPSVGDQHDAPLWRALAYARQGRWAQARESFKTMDAAVATLPVELQRVALKDEMRSAIEVGDFDGASSDLNDFETIGIPHAMEPAIAVLMGRLAEGMGRPEDALAAYRTAADSWDRPAAAQGLLRETVLRYSARRSQARRGDFAARIADHDLARRRDRDRGAQSSGASVHRRGPLSRRLLCHAQRHGGAAGFGADAPDPGRGGHDVRFAVPRRQGRRHAGDRRAGFVLRFPRAHADRQPRRRDDPPARRPAGVGRSARSGRRSVAVPGRSPLAGRRARAGGDPACRHLPDEPQARPGAGDAARDPHRRPVQRAARAAPVARGARAVRPRPPRAGARSDRRYSQTARRFGCAPIFCGRRGAGTNRPSRSS